MVDGPVVERGVLTAPAQTWDAAAPMAGTAEFRGTVGIHTVLIWGVIDRAAWEAEPDSTRWRLN